jgi:hypothetical protein
MLGVGPNAIEAAMETLRRHWTLVEHYLGR